MQKIKAIVFDLDGTLIDTIPLHAESFHGLFKDFGVNVPMKSIMPLMRLPTETIYQKLKVKKMLDIEMEKFIELRRKKYYSLLRGKQVVFKDAVPVLKKLSKYRLAIATNSSRQTLLVSTPHWLFKKFSVTVSFSEVLRAKPNPEMLLLAAKKMRTKPSECMMIGDSVMDIEAAKRAQMAPIAIYRKTGASGFFELGKKKPLVLLKSLEGIPAIVAACNELL